MASTSSDCSLFIPFLDAKIKIQRQAISSFKIWLIAQVAAGIAVVLLSVFSSKIFPGASSLSSLLPVGGGLLVVLGVFPGKEIIPRKETIAKLTFIRSNLENFDTLSPGNQ